MSHFIHFFKVKTNTKLKVNQLEHMSQKSKTDQTSELCDPKNSKFFIHHPAIKAHLHNRYSTRYYYVKQGTVITCRTKMT